jgi:hypothetical protein
VQSVFMELKTDFTKLCNAVFSRTGCNSTGEELFAEVWTNYICGQYLKFRYPAVTMYVFKLWSTHKGIGTLPKYCTKDILEAAQARIGLSPMDHMVVSTTPRTPAARGSSSSQGSPLDVQCLMMTQATVWFAAQEQITKAAAEAAGKMSIQVVQHISASFALLLRRCLMRCYCCCDAVYCAVAAVTLRRCLCDVVVLLP